MAINPFGKETDWNFIACKRLCPLYIVLCNFFGRKIGRTVPSIKPKQFSRGPPFS